MQHGRYFENIILYTLEQKMLFKYQNRKIAPKIARDDISHYNQRSKKKKKTISL